MKFLSRPRLPILSAAPATEGEEGEIAYHGGNLHLRDAASFKALLTTGDAPSRFEPHTRQFQQSLNGGGALTCTSGRLISWSERWISMSAGKNGYAAPGYFSIAMPADGTVITSANGGANTTVSGGYIAMPAWSTLYWAPNLGSASASDGTFKMLHYGGGSNFEVPATWILICAINSDANSSYFCRWGDGRYGTAGIGPTQRTLAFRELNNDQTTTFTATNVDVPNLSATVTTMSGQRVMLSGVVQFKAGTGDGARVHIVEGTTTIATSGVVMGVGTSIGVRAFATAIHSPTAGPHTYKVQIMRRLGTGTPSLEASATDPAYLLIEAI